MAHSNRAGPAGICRQFCAKASELIGLNIRTANAIIRNIIGPLEMQKAPRISNRNHEARARGRQPLVILCFDTPWLQSVAYPDRSRAGHRRRDHRNLDRRSAALCRIVGYRPASDPRPGRYDGAAYHPDRSWKLLAEAEYWEYMASAALLEHSKKCTASSNDLMQLQQTANSNDMHRIAVA